MNPYVPSEKTDGKSTDRILIDAQVEIEARRIAENTPTNFSVLAEYKALLFQVAEYLLLKERPEAYSHFRREGYKLDGVPYRETALASTIYDVGAKYNYQGAFLGELNYAITRLIQRVPQIKVELKQYPESSELRYWLYAVTVESLIYAASMFRDSGIGIAGVFEDIKDEYKRRVNTSYEAAQIIKSGDCYDTPYYTRLVEVVDVDGKLIGHQEIMVKRSADTLTKDVLDGKVVIFRRGNACQEYTPVGFETTAGE